MKLLLISFSVFIIAVSLSCRKEEIVVSGQKETLLVNKVEIADQPYYEFLYEIKDLLTEERSRINSVKHRYNSTNQLVSTDYYGDAALLSNDPQVFESAFNRKDLLTPENSEVNGTLIYNYNNNGQLTSTIYTRPSDGSAEKSEFTFDINGRIDRQTIFWDNKVTGYINYMYDGKGNITKETLYSLSSSGDAELNTTRQYEYDNNKNPFRVFYKLMIPGINTNSNNVIKETFTIHFKPGQGSDIVQVTLTSYSYNSNGYPVKKNGTVEYIYR